MDKQHQNESSRRILLKKNILTGVGLLTFICILFAATSPVLGQSDYHTVQSADGTTIGCTKVGSGPVPVVIVHGAINTHVQWMPVATSMSEQFTCYVMDRWGRGRSDDRTDYSITKEGEDIAAVLEEAGPDAFLMGHSSGAIYALEAALQTSFAGLILYEPPITAFEKHRFFEENRHPVRIAADEERWEDMISIFLADEGRMSNEELTALQASPFWDPIVDLAPVTAREWAEMEENKPTVSRYQNINVPTLFLAGSENLDHPSFAIQALNNRLPDARIVILEGHGHSAHLDDPELVVREITNFILETN